MAIKTKEEILNLLKEKTQDDTTDETLTFIEDVTDTLNNYDTQLAESGNWKDRYEANDKAWREKYRNRFFSIPSEKEAEEDYKTDEQKNKKTKYTELFKIGG